MTPTNGTTTTTASEQTISEVTGVQHYAHWLYLNNMTASETFRIKVYVYDQTSSTYRQYLTQDQIGVQASPAYYIPFIPARRYKVTIQRTAGSDRSVTWDRVEVA